MYSFSSTSLIWGTLITADGSFVCMDLHKALLITSSWHPEMSVQK